MNNGLKTVFKQEKLSIGELKDEEDIQNIQILDRVFLNKGIGCECIKITHTAICSVYDFELYNYNITFEKIKKLEKSLQMFLQKESIMVSPSKDTIGFTISVPHNNRVVIPIGNCLKLNTSTNPLDIIIGLDEGNNPVSINISKMPHLLIAGMTGSGKSVCMHTIISSIIAQNKPQDVQFVLIDPKQVEFSYYNDLYKYLAGEVITNVFRASTALYTICNNMDIRYKTISEAGCRDIDDFNSKSSQKYARTFVVIDELSELMLRNKKEVEKLIVRIAQLGRAAGIHLIVATQRPSHEVVTGLIKVNIPAKICFKVPNVTNSRIIIDDKGGEKLTGKGDGLLCLGDGSKFKRFQSAFITTDEISEMVSKLM